MSPMTLAIGLTLASAAASALASPFTPSSDNEIVMRLPYRIDAGTRVQRSQVLQGPSSLPAALEAARAAIERSRRHGDPRELGLAQAALAPWWSLPTPPPAVRLLRATVRQSQHEFDAALADLDLLVRTDPATPLPVQAQAELTRAAVLQVTGRLAEARAGCERLGSARFAALGSSVAIAAQACVAELLSLQGRARDADAGLAALAARTQDAAQGSWLALVRAELAERRGDAAGAAMRFGEAMRNGADVYARAAYADWLLDGRRYAEVLILLPAADSDADALLLRRAIALRRLGDAQAASAAGALQARFAAARERGDTTHLREEGRFELDVRGDAAAALKLAQANWARQKEPADAVLLARAAAAAGNREAAAPLRQLVRDTGWADVRLAAADRSLQP